MRVEVCHAQVAKTNGMDLKEAARRLGRSTAAENFYSHARKRVGRILSRRQKCFKSLTHCQLKAYVRQDHRVAHLAKRMTPSSEDKVVRQLIQTRLSVPKVGPRSSRAFLRTLYGFMRRYVMSMSFESGHTAIDVVCVICYSLDCCLSVLSIRFGISHTLIQVRDRDTPAASVDT